MLLSSFPFSLFGTKKNGKKSQSHKSQSHYCEMLPIPNNLTRSPALESDCGGRSAP